MCGQPLSADSLKRDSSLNAPTCAEGLKHERLFAVRCVTVTIAALQRPGV
jgi:hypothetical protein